MRHFWNRDRNVNYERSFSTAISFIFFFFFRSHLSYTPVARDAIVKPIGDRRTRINWNVDFETNSKATHKRRMKLYLPRIEEENEAYCPISHIVYHYTFNGKFLGRKTRGRTRTLYVQDLKQLAGVTSEYSLPRNFGKRQLDLWLSRSSSYVVDQVAILFKCNFFFVFVGVTSFANRCSRR